MNLYEIKENYLNALDQLVVNEDGEVENAELIETLNSDLEEKLENVALYIKNREAMRESIDAEIKALQARKKSIDTGVDYLKRLVSNTMIETEKTKFETAKVSLSFRNSKSVTIVDEEALPRIYTKAKYEVTPDKIKIKEALKEGHTVPGAILVENRNLILK